MSRFPKGTFNITANYELNFPKPFDARMLVKLKTDLTDSASWNKSGLYNGMLVVVGADPNEKNNGLYILCDKENVTLESSWYKLARVTDLSELEERLMDAIESIPASGGGTGDATAITVATLGELPNVGSPTNIYFVADCNKTYRWDGPDAKYYCVGVGDYGIKVLIDESLEEIKSIGGGDAHDDKGDND